MKQKEFSNKVKESCEPKDNRLPEGVKISKTSAEIPPLGIDEILK